KSLIYQMQNQSQGLDLPWLAKDATLLHPDLVKSIAKLFSSERLQFLTQEEVDPSSFWLHLRSLGTAYTRLGLCLRKLKREVSRDGLALRPSTVQELLGHETNPTSAEMIINMIGRKEKWQSSVAH